MYPLVIATTNKAPTKTGGAGTGMDNKLQPMPIKKPKVRPIAVLRFMSIPVSNFNDGCY